MTEIRSQSGVATAVMLSLCSVWAAIVGYWRIFSTFAEYDDEGYLMMTVRQVASGSVLYDQVYTQYGPAYYLYKSLLVQLLGIPSTHDATRLTTLVMWVLIAGVAGLLVHRLSRSAVFAGIGFIVSFYVLSRTVFEPGHPQELAGLTVLLVLLALLIDHRTIRFCVVSVLLAVLCLVKINLGVFLGTAIGVALLTWIDVEGWLRWVKIIFLLFALSLPLLLFYRFDTAGWLMFGFMISMTLATTAFEFNSGKGDRHIPIGRMAICYTIAAVLIVSFQMAMGSSAMGVLDGVILQHLRFGDDFVQPAPFLTWVFLWASVGSGAATLARSNKIPARWLTLLKLGFGMATITAALLDNRYNTNTFILLSFAMPWVWLGIITEDETSSLPRLALVFAAILMTLQVFPITGTQMSYGTVLIAVVGVVCAADAVKQIGDIVSVPRLKAVLTSAIAIGTLTAAAYFTISARKTYLANVPLELPGAQRIKLPAEQVTSFRGLTDRLRSQCDTFLTMPGLYSLYFWAEREPPTTLNTTAWMSLLDEEQQSEIVANAARVPRLCVVYHPQLTANGSRNRDLSKSPLASYIFSNFETVEMFGEYQFMQRR